MHIVLRTSFVAFLVTAVFEFGDNFYTLTNVTSWKEANRSCTLATPNINYTRQGFILDFGDGLDGVVGQYWVGYTTYNHIFQYIGCSDEEYVKGLSTGYKTIPSTRPGVCYSACGSDVFGVMGEHCYCITNRSNAAFVKQTCSLSCTHPGIKCGGENTVSIFEVAKPTMFNFARSPNDTEYCIAYDVMNHTFIWEDCYWSSRAQRCQTSSGYKLMTSSGGKRWGETADDYISRGKTNTLPLDVDNSDPCWTGYFRTDDCIHTFKVRGTPVLYGYVNIQDTNGQQKLGFGRAMTDLDAICDGKQAPTMFSTARESIATTTRKQAPAMLTTARESIATTPGKQASTMLTTARESIATAPGKQASTMLTTARESIATTPGKQTPTMLTTARESIATTSGKQAPTMLTTARKPIATTPGKQAPTMLTTAREPIATTSGKQAPTMFTTAREPIATTSGTPASTMLTTTKISIATTPGKQTSTMFTTAATESIASTPGKERGHLPIQIGVSLLILACVAVVVACVICCRRRRTNIKPSTQAPNIVEHYSQVQDPYDDAQNVYNEPFDNVTENQTNTGKHDHDNRSMPNDESEYDTCVVGKSATERKVGDNVYNTLELVTDDTYDHVNGPNNKRDTRADKPGSRNTKTGNFVVAENTYGRVDIEEGSYSHVNTDKRTPVTTEIATESKVGDNVYNTLELVTDDTYDHVNGPNNKRDTRADKPGSRKAKTGYGVVAENTYDRVDIEEGSYSHVNTGIQTPETTDNVYN